MRQESIDVSFDKMPKDWRLVVLGEIGVTYNGLTGKSKEDFGTGEPFIPYMNIFSNNSINPTWLEYVTISANENQNQVKYGDIFFTTSSETPKEVGMSSVLLKDIGVAYLNSFCFGFRLNDFNTLIPEYAKFLFRGKEVRKSIIVFAQGSTRFNLSKTTLLKRLTLLLPPLPEQKKIADILTTVDDKLENIESQIAEYTNLKTGLMQLLLTKGIGHTKFVDSELGMIPEGWKVVKLGDIGEFSKGKGISKSDVVSNGIPCIRYGEIYTVHHYVVKKFYSYITKEVAANSKLLNKNDILFAGSGETVEDIGKAIAYIGDEEAYAGGDTIIFSPKEDDSVFLSYCLNDKTVTSQRVKFGQGNSVVHIYSKDLCKLFVPKPPIKEQQKISNILNAVDDKIESLQQKKEEFTNLKKGLMEQLLTGRIRVKV